ncbi:hypothetical protein FEM48_Zijuj07G0049000 [Ziziphus jujuba var. spinosa]|uniref:NB-ARC domain-containing protein n=1 Tax=Ziziphus jujuba var. spinosa TaxID=714518 RepID=A0A978V2K3_ZIZJJ|nr:hypothetical protein FEM48_Zijuj07G0049000 [Ziziphus jujuba var. spinosa]
MLQPLPLDKTWQLFCNKAFQFEFAGYCPAELVNLSGKIAKRCEGLTLVIVAIAGLLYAKEETVAEWQKLHDNLSSELESNPHLTSMTRILSLSYNDLPYYLRSCFLCLAMYPEDYTIKGQNGIHGVEVLSCDQCILFYSSSSLNFVGIADVGKKDRTLEVVAQEYLMELINRSLFGM